MGRVSWHSDMGRASADEAGGLQMASDGLCIGPAGTVTDGAPLMCGAAAKGAHGGMQRWARWCM